MFQLSHKNIHRKYNSRTKQIQQHTQSTQADKIPTNTKLTMAAVMAGTPPSPPQFADIPYHQWQDNTANSIEIKPPQIEDDFIQFGWKDFPAIVKDMTLRMPSNSTCAIDFDEEDSENVSPTTATASIYDINMLAEMVAQQCATVTSSSSPVGSGASQTTLPYANILNNLSYPTSKGSKSSSRSPSKKLNHRRKSSSSKKLVVKFNLIRIREHCITVGDHDWCEGQLPLTLDWKAASKEQIYHIDDYERTRQRSRMPRGKLPKLDYWQRKSLLRSVAGLTERDMTQLEERRHKKIMVNSYADLKRCRTVTRFQSQELLGS